jgi:hypothetical protein
MSDIPNPPAGTDEPGRRLWQEIVELYELEAHELVLLEQACRTLDLCETLQTTVDREGPIVAGRTTAATVELRLQRVMLGRLLTALRIPIGDAQGRQQYRGSRGFYGLRAVDG